MPYDPFAPGPFAVGARTMRLTDAARGRTHPCELWYPAPGATGGGESRDAESLPGPLPLAVYSHLSGGGRRSASFLCRHLAGHGYAVAAPDHSEVVAPELAPCADETPERRAARAGAIVTSRVPDLRLVLDHLLDAGAGAATGTRVDGERVGLVGHSFGGWTVLAAPETEPRARAVVAMAPAGNSRPRPGILAVGLTFAWHRTVDTLLLAGDADVMTPLDGVTELLHRAPEPKRMLVLAGADHLHLVDDPRAAHESLRASTLPGEAGWIPGAMRPFDELCPAEQAHDFARALCLAHLDASLRERGDARSFLDGAPEALRARGIEARAVV